jgi:uncharacterized membrane protein
LHIGVAPWEAKPAMIVLLRRETDNGGRRLQQSMDLEPGRGRERWPAIDLARGVAIAAMVVYHLAWDLSFVRLIATDVISHPAWQMFARTIAAAFLMLVGIGLVLGHGEGVRWRSFGQRLALLAGAALAVSILTRIAFPDGYIFFGILHSIAVSSVLALPFLRAPLPLIAAAAAFCFVAPLLFTAPALDAPFLDWLGLGSRTPLTNDYVPVFPWFGVVLIGVAAGRLLRSWRPGPPTASPSPGGLLSRVLIWSGRRSLLIYLLHQPLLLGGLLLLVQATGPNPAAEEAIYKRDCEQSCRESGATGPRCAAGCGCAVERLKGSGLWRPALDGKATPADQERLSSFVRQCFAE